LSDGPCTSNQSHPRRKIDGSQSVWTPSISRLDLGLRLQRKAIELTRIELNPLKPTHGREWQHRAHGRQTTGGPQCPEVAQRHHPRTQPSSHSHSSPFHVTLSAHVHLHPPSSVPVPPIGISRLCCLSPPPSHEHSLLHFGQVRATLLFSWPRVACSRLCAAPSVAPSVVSSTGGRLRGH